MALSLLRLRRAVCLSSTLLTRHPSTASPSLSAALRNPSSAAAALSRHFRSFPPSLSSARQSFRNNSGGLDEEIGPDTILFEGCDYNHWLITMDFPKDPAPTRQEMIETYLQTLAKVVGSYEEAKKKMYACSTTTYQGFQCLVSEEESEKFKGLPGVVFVLPDSYIDPVNKEYGGDKYDNGVITPRPPPMQYGRQGGRYGDRNRDFNRYPRQTADEQGSRGYNNQGPRNFGQQQSPIAPNQQGNQGYGNQGPRYQDNRNFGPLNNPQVPNQQPSPAYSNQGPTSGVNRNFGQAQNLALQPNHGPTVGGERNAMPPYQANYNQNQQGYYNPQGERVPHEQRGYTGDNRNYAPSQGQGFGANYGQMPAGNYGQGATGNQPRAFNYQQNHLGHGEGNRTVPTEQRNNAQAEQINYGEMGQTGAYQGRY